jgi:hypothetical protein
VAREQRKAVITWADEVEEEIAEFLVPKRIPRGELSLLAGMHGIGKSLWHIEIAACLTRGLWDDPAKVLITSTEDSINTQIKPRLRAAGAVLKNIGFVSIQLEDEDAGQIRFPDDVDEFARVIEEGDFRFAVIDPILGHLNSQKVSTFKDEQLRDGLMTPLSRIAKEYDCAVLGVMHFNKRSEGESLLRVSGSLGGIVGPARSLLLMHKSPDEEEQRILTHEKSNYGPLAGSLAYELESITLRIRERDVTHPHLRYVGDSDYTGIDLLTGKADPPGRVKEALEFLEAELADGPKPAKEVRAAAKELGISDYAFATAKKKRGIVSVKSEFRGAWDLMLPVYDLPKVTVTRTKNADRRRRSIRGSHSSHPSTKGKSHPSTSSTKDAKGATSRHTTRRRREEDEKWTGERDS